MTQFLNTIIIDQKLKILFDDVLENIPIRQEKKLTSPILWHYLKIEIPPITA